MSFDEHLIVYMFQINKTRSATELAIVEFLASLKYYASEWPRAKNYALMLGFYQSDDSFVSLRKSGTSDTKLPPRLNDGKINELDEPYYDIYQ